MPAKSNFIQLLIIAIFSYGLLLVGHGYVFGHLGTMETFPYLKELADPSLYPNDFYIEGIQSRFPDVRWIFVQWLRIFHISGAWVAFFAHFLVSLALLVGMLKVALIFTESLTSAFLATLLTLLILYNHNLGGNELYYNSLAPSLLAKSIGIWSIYLFLKGHFHWAILLLIPATFVHPMVGIQLFVIGVLGCLGIRMLGDKKANSDQQRTFFGWSILIFLLTAGLWIVRLQISFDDVPISSEKLFSILFFRLGHHYFPSQYPINDYLLLIPFFLFGWWYFWKRNSFIFLFYAWVILGLMVYTAGVELAQIPTILSAQWFKTTIWLKFFSSIALFAYLEEKLILKNDFLRKLYKSTTIITFLGLGVFLFFKLPKRHPLTLDLPWRGAYNDRIKIALLAKAKTPKDALFITPPDFTHLKYYGERSTYVDYKATIHFHSKLLEWFDRIQKAYTFSADPINSQAQLTGHGLYTRHDTAYLKSLGITHIITKSKPILPKRVIGHIGDYWILEL